MALEQLSLKNSSILQQGKCEQVCMEKHYKAVKSLSLGHIINVAFAPAITAGCFSELLEPHNTYKAKKSGKPL